MSLFGALMGDFEDDFFGGHMNAMNMQMRNMNRLMNSFMPDPFNMLSPFEAPHHNNALMERQVGGGSPFGGLFGFPAMPPMNRLLNADIGNPNGAAFCSSSVFSMSSGPDGRPQIYQATQTTKTGPGGIRETRKTVQDSTKGIKKMAIGHHIGERAHIIEKEEDLRSGQLEERQEFINLDEVQAEDFDREFVNKANMGVHRRPHQQEILTIEPADDDDEGDDDEPPRRHRRQMLALPSTQPQQQQQQQQHNSSNDESSADDENKSLSLQQQHQQQQQQHNDQELPASRIISRSHLNATNLYGNNTNNNNNYLNTTPRRSVATTGVYHHHLHPHQLHHHYPYVHRTHHGHVAVAPQPRRPLRTPLSSPLVTVASPSSAPGIVTSPPPSIHPHPYNASAARRNYRPKHTKHRQQTQSQVEITELDSEPLPQQQPQQQQPQPQPQQQSKHGAKSKRHHHGNY